MILKNNRIAIKYISTIKTLIWIYIFLLIFEGALRKWIFPSLASPLLIIRDPVAILILLFSFKSNNSTFNFYVVSLFLVCFISIPIALYFGHGNLLVALYGARIFILHFPLIFIIGDVFNVNDVIKVGKFMLILAIPMTFLIATQFYSPQSAFVNRGIGGDVNGAGFSGALDFFRPPGTFSFTSGNVCFYIIVLSFIFPFWLSTEIKMNKYALFASTIAFIIAVPICISRTLFFQLFLTGLFNLVALSTKPKLFRNLVVIIVGAAFILFLLKDISFFATATEAFTSRYISANETEGGVKGVFLDRFLGGLVGAITNSSNIPYFGYGIGLGTNVGNQLINGQIGFTIAEAEWGRLIGEMGFILGIVIILIRIVLGFDLLIKSFKAANTGNLLSVNLMSWVFLAVLQYQLGQPTALGFTVLGSGLAMAALNENFNDNFN